jgi:hypothetical protein
MVERMVFINTQSSVSGSFSMILCLLLRSSSLSHISSAGNKLSDTKDIVKESINKTLDEL